MSRRGRGGRNRHGGNNGGSGQQAGQQGGGRGGQQGGQQGAQQGGQQGGGRGGQQGGQGNRGDNRNQGRQQQASPDESRSQGQQQLDRSGGKLAFQSALQPRKTISRAPSAATAAVAPKPAERTYKAVYFDTLAQAKSDLNNLRELASQCDQLNIIIRAEASMDDPDLTSIGKLFCGAAWTLIHDRRAADGWYSAPHE